MKNKRTSRKKTERLSRSAKHTSDRAFGIKDLMMLILTITVSAALLLASLVEANVISIKQIERALHIVPAAENDTDSSVIPDAAREVSVSMIDVGQGDAILIRAGKRNVLIDTGESDKAYTIEQYLKESGVSVLDLVVVTHQHTDHMGGMAHIIDSFEVGQVIMPDAPDDLIPPTYTYESFLDAAEAKGVRISPALAGYVYKLTDGDMPVTLSILAPKPDSGFTDLNDWSVVAKLVHGQNSFLFTGDLTENGEKVLTDSDVDISANVLKVGHHGSPASSSREFLHKVKPDIALISVGADNTYGHPSEEALKRISRYTDRIYRTDEHGTVTVWSDGERLYVEKEK